MALITLASSILRYTHNLGGGYPDTATTDLVRNVKAMDGAPAIPPAGVYRVWGQTATANASLGIFALTMDRTSDASAVNIVSYHRGNTTYRTTEIILDFDFLIECDGVNIPRILGAATNFHGVNLSMESSV